MPLYIVTRPLVPYIGKWKMRVIYTLYIHPYTLDPSLHIYRELEDEGYTLYMLIP